MAKEEERHWPWNILKVLSYLGTRTYLTARWLLCWTAAHSAVLRFIEALRHSSGRIQPQTQSDTPFWISKKRKEESAREKSRKKLHLSESVKRNYSTAQQTQLADTRLLLNESKKLLKDFIHPAPADGDKLFSPFSQVFSFHHWDADEETQTNQTILQIAFSVYYSKH